MCLCWKLQLVALQLQPLLRACGLTERALSGWKALVLSFRLLFYPEGVTVYQGARIWQVDSQS